MIFVTLLESFGISTFFSFLQTENASWHIRETREGIEIASRLEFENAFSHICL